MTTVFLFTLFLYLTAWTPRRFSPFEKVIAQNKNASEIDQTGEKNSTPLEVLDLLAQYLKVEPNTLKAFEKVFYKNIDLENVNEVTDAFYKKCSSYSKKNHIKLAALNTVLSIRVSNTLGVPLYKTLLRTKKSLSDEIETMNTWKMTTAGPRTTARILQCLPLLGIFIGFLFGVNPLAVFIDMRFGTAIFVIGLALNIAGMRLVKSMERKIWKQFYF
ncbi:MAG: hypothetical protein LBB10_01730 [Bifidobacteriaceae bacterium]|jgi:hypothetical protein|nr:hypothetical protein [Bifidobacteriaceae bacterium]